MDRQGPEVVAGAHLGDAQALTAETALGVQSINQPIRFKVVGSNMTTPTLTLSLRTPLPLPPILDV